MSSIGIISIQCNRAPWISEWVLFHAQLGVKSFYIGLHKTTDESFSVLASLAKRIDIKVFFVPEVTKKAPQLDFYQYIFDRYLSEVDWMAVIDGDEFLFPANGDNLNEVLINFNSKEWSALAVYWRCFGSSNHIEEPDGLIIENYTLRPPDDFPPNQHVKSIINTRYAKNIKASGSHVFTTELGTYDEQERLINHGHSEFFPSYQTLIINHYVCQSYEYFSNVKKKKDAMANIPEQKSEDWWNGHNRNDLRCDEIKRFIPKLKQAINEESQEKNLPGLKLNTLAKLQKSILGVFTKLNSFIRKSNIEIERIY
jgi:hypothetical protein